MTAIGVVYDGALVVSSTPITVVGGTSMAPLRPYVVAIASQIAYGPGASVTISRGDRSITVRAGSLSAQTDAGDLTLPGAPFERSGTFYVPLVAVARALGDEVAYSERERTIAIDDVPVPSVSVMGTPAPGEPRASPTVLFPSAPVQTPRTPSAGMPRPRRTPIAVTPSWP